MEIKEFVKTTLSQICEAIYESSKELKKDITLDNPNTNNGHSIIKFDLAVEATDKTNSSQRGGLKIHIVDAGVNREAATTSSSTSRIQFAIEANFYAHPGDDNSSDYD